MILTAEIESRLAGPSDPQVTIKDIEELKKAIALAPDALHGEGELLVARGYSAIYLCCALSSCEQRSYRCAPDVVAIGAATA
jgi:hypothetical protein